MSPVGFDMRHNLPRREAPRPVKGLTEIWYIREGEYRRTEYSRAEDGRWWWRRYEKYEFFVYGTTRYSMKALPWEPLYNLDGTWADWDQPPEGTKRVTNAQARLPTDRERAIQERYRAAVRQTLGESTMDDDLSAISNALEEFG